MTKKNSAFSVRDKTRINQRGFELLPFQCLQLLFTYHPSEMLSCIYLEGFIWYFHFYLHRQTWTVVMCHSVLTWPQSIFSVTFISSSLPNFACHLIEISNERISGQLSCKIRWKVVDKTLHARSVLLLQNWRLHSIIQFSRFYTSIFFLSKCFESVE